MGSAFRFRETVTMYSSKSILAARLSTNNIPIPEDHPQGLYWYHPHFHPGVNAAIAGGLSGGLIIGNILAPLGGEYQNLTERIMLLKDLKLDENGQPVPDPDPAGPTIRTINGLLQ